MAECKQCGVHVMVPPEDERCPMCGCEDMYDYEYFVSRCEITGNPVGTDTWGQGQVCQCAACQQFLKDT